VKNASHPQTFRDLDEHRRVVDKGDLLAGVWARSSARRKISTSGLRMPTKQEEMKVSANWSSLNLRMRCALTARDSLLTTTIFSYAALELSDKFDHPGVRLRLSEHEVPKLVPRECSLFIKDHPAEIFLKAKLSFFVGLEDQAMALVHLRPIQIEVLGRPFAGQMVPSIGEQDSADIHKERRDRNRSFH
jgi:hypothetical protein